MTIRYQTKSVTQNIAIDGDVADLAFTSLNPKKLYRVDIQFRLLARTANGLTLQAVADDDRVVAQCGIELGKADSSVKLDASEVSPPFTETENLKFVLKGIEVSVDAMLNNTSATLYELDDFQQVAVW